MRESNEVLLVFNVKINNFNSLEKLQDGRNHLCYGVHGGILVTVTGNTNDLSPTNNIKV